MVWLGERWSDDGDLRRFLTRVGPVGLWLGGLALLFVTLRYYEWRLGWDADAYWDTGHLTHGMYDVIQGPNRYLYSPAFAQVIAPLTQLPWPAFVTVWTVAEFAAFLWLLKPLGFRWAAPLMLWCSPELVIGNILGFVGVALVLGVTRPWAWPMMLLTKPSFGICTLWLVVRREWKRTTWVLATTAGVIAASFVYEPRLWFEWVHFLSLMSTGAGDAGGTLPLRMVGAAALAAYAGRSGRAGLLPFVLLLATPVFAGAPSLTILAAMPRLISSGKRLSETDGQAAEADLLVSPARTEGPIDLADRSARRAPILDPWPRTPC